MINIETICRESISDLFIEGCRHFDIDSLVCLDSSVIDVSFKKNAALENLIVFGGISDELNPRGSDLERFILAIIHHSTFKIEDDDDILVKLFNNNLDILKYIFDMKSIKTFETYSIQSLFNLSCISSESHLLSIVEECLKHDKIKVSVNGNFALKKIISFPEILTSKPLFIKLLSHGSFDVHGDRCSIIKYFIDNMFTNDMSDHNRKHVQEMFSLLLDKTGIVSDKDTFNELVSYVILSGNGILLNNVFKLMKRGKLEIQDILEADIPFN